MKPTIVRAGYLARGLLANSYPEVTQVIQFLVEWPEDNGGDIWTWESKHRKGLSVLAIDTSADITAARWMQLYNRLKSPRYGDETFQQLLRLHPMERERRAREEF